MLSRNGVLERVHRDGSAFASARERDDLCGYALVVDIRVDTGSLGDPHVPERERNGGKRIGRTRGQRLFEADARRLYRYAGRRTGGAERDQEQWNGERFHIHLHNGAVVLRAGARALSAGFEVTRVPFLTRELHETIVRAESTGIRSTIAAVERLFPEANAAGIDVAGGVAAFAGANSPFSKAFGLGTFGPVSAGDIACVSEFYESRNAVARIFVTPLADPMLGATLAKAGYAPVEYDSVMVAVDPDSHALRDDRIAIASDVAAWARASVNGFMDRDRNLHDDSLARIIGSAQGVIPLEAREDGTIVATAALTVRGECASLIAGSTLREFRRRGWQLALIRDRIARALDAGARIIFAAAAPASVSERNFHRCGFVTMYTRARWDRQPA